MFLPGHFCGRRAWHQWLVFFWCLEWSDLKEREREKIVFSLFVGRVLSRWLRLRKIRKILSKLLLAGGLSFFVHFRGTWRSKLESCWTTFSPQSMMRTRNLCLAWWRSLFETRWFPRSTDLWIRSCAVANRDDFEQWLKWEETEHVERVVVLFVLPMADTLVGQETERSSKLQRNENGRLTFSQSLTLDDTLGLLRVASSVSC